MFFSHDNYRGILKSLLAERIAKNPSYSLNALAGKLGITQGFLSEVLNGHKNLSQEASLKIARRLDLNEAETEYFCLLVQLETTKDSEVREALLEKLNVLGPRQKIHNLSVDTFRAIANWHHSAILEMTFVEDFDSSSKSISKALGISQVEVEAAIERLLRLGLLERDQNGRIRKTEGYLFVESKIPNKAVQSFHRQLLEKAIESLPLPREKRQGRSEVLPLDPALMGEAEKIMDEAAAKIAALAKRSHQKSEVYAMTFQFFPITKKGK